MADSRPKRQANDIILWVKQIEDWDDYFMAFACVAAMRSKDRQTKVGCCIVKDDVLISTGYNGLPRKFDDNFFKHYPSSELKEQYVCYAVQNAIQNNKGKCELKGSKLYVTLYPSHKCAQMIIQEGITEVIYLSDKKQTEQSCLTALKLFAEHGIEPKKFDYEKDAIIVDFRQFYEFN